MIFHNGDRQGGKDIVIFYYRFNETSGTQHIIKWTFNKTLNKCPRSVKTRTKNHLSLSIQQKLNSKNPITPLLDLTKSHQQMHLKIWP